MTIRLHILDSGCHFGRRLPLIRRTLEAAIHHVEQRSDLSNVDMAVHPIDFGHDQFPISAFTMGPHNIHIGIERSQLSSEELEPDLYRFTIHELHHALRWRHVAKVWTVAEAVVLEGLAVLADHDAAGPQDLTDRPLSAPEDALATLAVIRGDRLEGQRDWLYSSETAQPGGIGRVYSVGHLVMKSALAALSLDPWQAALHPADALVDAGMHALAARTRRRSA
ncbi:MAG: DUF2268 domain-containing putative Zn-dependent protease [Pseudomonadota bacterium]